MNIETLNHKPILKAMFKDRMITANEAKRIVANLLNTNLAPSHPLVGIARSLPAHQENGEKITLEALSEWFAKSVGVDYFYIDPLNIDIAAVTKVIASDYAKRHGF
jgi:general secretion pathway protein E